jgi:hypothetical protein
MIEWCVSNLGERHARTPSRLTADSVCANLTSFQPHPRLTTGTRVALILRMVTGVQGCGFHLEMAGPQCCCEVVVDEHLDERSPSARMRLTTLAALSSGRIVSG